MANATSNRVAVRIVEESTWGETPATPELQTLRMTGEGLNYSPNFITSDEIRDDRMTSDSIQVGSSSGGPINGELSFGTYDQLIEGAMFGSWSTAGAELVDSGIGITKVDGTPNSWLLTSSGGDFDSQGWVVGQWVKIQGFTAGLLFAEIVSITADEMAIYPTEDVPTTGSGASITITPLDFVRNGTVEHSYTVQKAFTDLSPVVLQNFTGSKVASWNVELGTGSILKTTFTTLAEDANMANDQFAGASVLPASTTQVLNAVDNVASIVFDGDPGGSQYFFNSLSISLDNALRGQQAVSKLGFIGVVPGRLNLTGSIELYFKDKVLFDTMKAAKAFRLSFTLADNAGNTYIFTIPRAKFSGMEIVASGGDQDVFASGEFTTLANADGTYQYQISRLAA